jgi:hypothetical protein
MGGDNKKSKKKHAMLSTTDGVSTGNSWKICPEDLSLFPYRKQKSQPLSEDGIARRYAFARVYKALLEDSAGVLNVTWSSYDLHFNFDGHTANGNKRSTRRVTGQQTLSD